MKVVVALLLASGWLASPALAQHPIVSSYDGPRTGLFSNAMAELNESQATRMTASSDERCDSDADGALIGTLIGALPGALMMITDDSSGEELIPPVAILFAGGFVGFWAGLAIDSLDCPYDPATGERGPE